MSKKLVYAMLSSGLLAFAPGCALDVQEDSVTEAELGEDLASGQSEAQLDQGEAAGNEDLGAGVAEVDNIPASIDFTDPSWMELSKDRYSED